MPIKKDSGETSALATGVKELASVTLKSDIEHNLQDALAGRKYSTPPGVLGAVTLTVASLAVTLPTGSKYVAGGVVWVADGNIVSNVPDAATTYLWGVVDGLIVQTTSTAIPGGYTEHTACILVKATASGGAATLDHSVQQQTRSSASRVASEGGAASFDYANKTLRALAGLVTSTSKTTMSGNLIIAKTDACAHLLDPNGSDRDVTLPASPETGRYYRIKHNGGANTLTVKNSGGSTVTTLTTAQKCELLYDGAAWHVW